MTRQCAGDFAAADIPVHLALSLRDLEEANSGRLTLNADQQQRICRAATPA